MSSTSRPRLLSSTFGIALSSMLLLAACGGEDSAADDTGVATLEASETTGVAAETDETEDADDSTAAGEDAAEDAALAFASCVRDEGYPDFADPTVGADGEVQLQDSFLAADLLPGDAEFDEVFDACGELIDGVGLGGQDAEQAQADAEETLLGYTECLRGEGLDVGDVDFDQLLTAGGQAAREGGADATDPGDFLASLLGQDAEDPAWQAAHDACFSVIAFGA